MVSIADQSGSTFAYFEADVSDPGTVVLRDGTRRLALDGIAWLRLPLATSLRKLLQRAAGYHPAVAIGTKPSILVKENDDHAAANLLAFDLDQALRLP
jgi:hypothetical protein